MIWTPYTRAPHTQFAITGELILNASEDGSWVVWGVFDNGMIGSKASADKWGGQEKDLEGAKQAAEKAANETNNG